MRAACSGNAAGLPVNVMMQASIRPSTSKVSSRIDFLQRVDARAGDGGELGSDDQRIVHPRRAMIAHIDLADRPGGGFGAVQVGHLRDARQAEEFGAGRSM